MALFGKMRAKFHDDWCENCLTEMQTVKKQLFYMPQSVGHYTRHEDAAYYIKNLVPVEKKAQIPTGMYACGMYVYRCMQCGARYVKLTPFLPVRDAEKNELPLLFMKGELDALIERSEPVRETVRQGHGAGSAEALPVTEGSVSKANVYLSGR